MKPTFVRQASTADALDVAQRLRKEDREECLAATGGDPVTLLPLLAEGGNMLAAGLRHNDRAEILFGVDPHNLVKRVGTIWLLSTPVIYDYPVEFVVRTKELLTEFHKDYDLLTNFIDARNTRHIRWLAWMGFKKVRDVERYGAENRHFIEFVSYRQCA